MIKNIIFDFGGVILDLTKKHTLSVPQALSILFEVPIEDAVELWRDDRDDLLIGKDSPQEFLERIKLRLNSDKDVEKLFQEWKLMNQKDKELIDWDMMIYIKDLKRKYKVYVLSDAVGIAQDDNFTKEIESKFDGFFVSYREGLKKPHKEAFLNALNKMQAIPEECLFVDDTEANVEAANNLGIKSFKYISLKELKLDLEKVGVVS